MSKYRKEGRCLNTNHTEDRRKLNECFNKDIREMEREIDGNGN